MLLSTIRCHAVRLYWLLLPLALTGDCLKFSELHQIQVCAPGVDFREVGKAITESAEEAPFRDRGRSGDEGLRQPEMRCSWLNLWNPPNLKFHKIHTNWKIMKHHLPRSTYSPQTYQLRATGFCIHNFHRVYFSMLSLLLCSKLLCSFKVQPWSLHSWVIYPSLAGWLHCSSNLGRLSGPIREPILQSHS